MPRFYKFGHDFHPTHGQFLKNQESAGINLDLVCALVVLPFATGLTTKYVLPHIPQGLQGCDMGSDGRLLHWYKQLAYDGLDLPTWKEDLSSWTAATHTGPQIPHHKIEAYLKSHWCRNTSKKGRRDCCVQVPRGAKPRPCFL